MVIPPDNNFEPEDFEMIADLKQILSGFVSTGFTDDEMDRIGVTYIAIIHTVQTIPGKLQSMANGQIPIEAKVAMAYAFGLHTILDLQLRLPDCRRENELAPV